MAITVLSAEERLQQRHEANMAAKKRYMESRYMSILAHPTQFNRWELQAAQAWQAQKDARENESAQRNHETGMQTIKNKGAVDVAHENRLGMENQGIGVGRLKHGYVDENGKRVQGSEEITEHERREAEKEKSRNEFGYEGQDGQWHPGSRERVSQHGLTQAELEWGKNNPDGSRAPGGREKVAENEGRFRLGLEQERGKTTLEIARENRKAAEATAFGKKKDRWEERRKRYAEREQRDYENWKKSALNPNSFLMTDAERAAFNNMTPEDQKKFWREKQGRDTADQVKGANGEKWVIVRDANGNPIGKRRVQ
ncbi:MAG: hypothetical protein IKO55_04255 [Kiritimatiellae bacterium]|nr:hypothetical protein [Kiritimatiellia bacterium]